MTVNGLQFDLVSPQQRLLSETVVSVTCPGTEGDFGVLPGHAPLVASLRPGVVTIQRDGEKQTIFIAGGFADVSDQQLTVLAEEAIPVNDLDADAIAKDIATLQEDIKLAGTDADRAAMQKSLDILQTKQEYAG